MNVSGTGENMEVDDLSGLLDALVKARDQHSGCWPEEHGTD